MSSPLKVIVPSVTSRPGWPMIAFASVDLPEPFGPIRAWMRPFSTSRSSPLRISLSSARHVQVADLKLCQFGSFGVRFAGLGLGGAGDRALRARRRLTPFAAGECCSANSTRSASVVPDSALVTPPCTRVQSSFVAQAWSPSVSCEQETLPSGSAWKHSIGAIAPSSACTTSSMSISLGGPAQPVAAVGAALALDQAGLAQLRDQVLEVGEGEPLGLGDGAQRHRGAAILAAQLHHQADPVLGSGREQHREKS